MQSYKCEQSQLSNHCILLIAWSLIIIFLLWRMCKLLWWKKKIPFLDLDFGASSCDWLLIAFCIHICIGPDFCLIQKNSAVGLVLFLYGSIYITCNHYLTFNLAHCALLSCKSTPPRLRYVHGHIKFCCFKYAFAQSPLLSRFHLVTDNSQISVDMYTIFYPFFVHILSKTFNHWQYFCRLLSVWTTFEAAFIALYYVLRFLMSTRQADSMRLVLVLEYGKMCSIFFLFLFICFELQAQQNKTF